MLSKELQQRTPSPSQTPSLDFKCLMREGFRCWLIDWWSWGVVWLPPYEKHYLSYSWRSDCGKGSRLGKILSKEWKIIARCTQKGITEVRLEPRHLIMIEKMLKVLIPKARVWCFGSRVYGRGLKHFSNLDLVVRYEEDMHADVEKMRDAYEAFDLPIKVDLSVWNHLPGWLK